MLVEPPRPRLSGRAGPPLLNAAAPRVRIRRRVDIERGPKDIANPTVGAAVLVAAFTLAVTSRGDVVVLAVLLGLGVRRRSSGLAAAASLAAAMVRWGSPSLRAIAGAQAVLGPAGWTGSTAAVASAWLAAIALVGAARPVARTTLRLTAAAAAPFAVAAADVVAGPSAGGALGLRIAASAAALVLAVIAARFRWAPVCACAFALAALVAAGLAR